MPEREFGEVSREFRESLSVKELASLCGVTPGTIYRALRNGEIHYWRTSDRAPYRIPRRAALAWLERNSPSEEQEERRG